MEREIALDGGVEDQGDVLIVVQHAVVRRVALAGMVVQALQQVQDFAEVLEAGQVFLLDRFAYADVLLRLLHLRPEYATRTPPAQ